MMVSTRVRVRVLKSVQTFRTLPASAELATVQQMRVRTRVRVTVRARVRIRGTARGRGRGGGRGRRKA